MQTSSNTHTHTHSPSHQTNRHTHTEHTRAHTHFLALSSRDLPVALWPLPRLLFCPGCCILVAVADLWALLYSSSALTGHGAELKP